MQITIRLKDIIKFFSGFDNILTQCDIRINLEFQIPRGYMFPSRIICSKSDIRFPCSKSAKFVIQVACEFSKEGATVFLLG
jgi:hypothetical protein